MADVRTDDISRRALAKFATLVKAAINGEVAEQIAGAKAKEARATVAVHSDTYRVRLTAERLNEIGQEAAGGAALKRRVKLFENFTPEAYAEKVKEWTTRVCESERDKLTAAHAARERAEAATSESAGDSGAYERVTAADLADSPETEEADEAESYVLECNAPEPPPPPISQFQIDLGKHVLHTVQDAVANRNKIADSTQVSVRGVLALALEVKKGGNISIVDIKGREGFEYIALRSDIMGRLNSNGRLKDYKGHGLEPGVYHFNIIFPSAEGVDPIVRLVS